MKFHILYMDIVIHFTGYYFVFILKRSSLLFNEGDKGKIV